jgi:hypothetical protein
MSEFNNSNYKLAICHLFHPMLHGHTENSDRNILGEYLVFYTIEINDYYNNQYISYIDDLKYFYNAIVLDYTSHPTIRNYNNIIKNENYIKIDINKKDLLIGLEEVGYIKTFWLKLFQRKWKKIFYNRKRIIKKMSNPKYLLKREITGK